MKFFGVIFSASDFKHPVIIPAMTLMCECLTLAPVMSEKDVLLGLFICHTIVMYCKNTARFTPEVLNFLYKVVGLMQYTKGTLMQSNYPKHPLDRFMDIGAVILECGSLDFSLMVNGSIERSDRGALLVIAYKMLFKQAALISESSSFIDLLKTLNDFLRDCKCISLFTVEIAKFELDMKKALLFRRPLQLQKRKPVPIASYLPKFDEK